MRLFTKCHNCSYKIFINNKAETRNDLPPSFDLTCLHCGKIFSYTPFEVFAEVGITTTEGAFLGGLIGLMFGGAGALAGAILGGALGRTNEEQDNQKVLRFNNS